MHIVLLIEITKSKIFVLEIWVVKVFRANVFPQIICQHILIELRLNDNVHL